MSQNELLLTILKFVLKIQKSPPMYMKTVFDWFFFKS